MYTKTAYSVSSEQKNKNKNNQNVLSDFELKTGISKDQSDEPTIFKAFDMNWSNIHGQRKI